jgi:hypothetical protein
MLAIELIEIFQGSFESIVDYCSMHGYPEPVALEKDYMHSNRFSIEFSDGTWLRLEIDSGA